MYNELMGMQSDADEFERSIPTGFRTMVARFLLNAHYVISVSLGMCSRNMQNFVSTMVTRRCSYLRHANICKSGEAERECTS